jgi:hypothetical protein
LIPGGFEPFLLIQRLEDFVLFEQVEEIRFRMEKFCVA